MVKKLLMTIMVILVFASICHCGSLMERILFKKANIYWEKKNYVLSEKLYAQCLKIDSENKKFLYRYLLSKMNQNKYIEVLSFFDNLKMKKLGLKLLQLKRNARTQLFMNTKKVDGTVKAKISKKLNASEISFNTIPDAIEGKKGENIKIILDMKKFKKNAKNIYVHLEKIGYPYYANFCMVEKKEKLWEINFSIKKKFSDVKLDLPIYVFYSKKDFYYYNLRIIMSSGSVKVEGLSYTNELQYLNDRAVMMSRGEVKFKDFKIVVPGQTINSQSLDKGKKLEIGTDYFIWVVATKDKNAKTILTKKKKDIKNGQMIGYFHVGPAGKILRYSVTTNDNLDGSTLAPGIPLPGMVKVGKFAMDIYECSMFDGKVSPRYGVKPLAFVHQGKARMLARKAGKRLPTNAEWFFCAQSCKDPDLYYRGNGKEYGNIWPLSIPLNSKDFAGVTNNPHGQNGVKLTGGTLTGTCPLDVNMYGNYDMVGNIREWVNDASTGKEPLEDGYIAEVDGNGNVTKTQKLPNKAFNGDYYLSSRGRPWNAVLRGGCWYDGQRGGKYYQNLFCRQAYFSYSTGLRCAR